MKKEYICTSCGFKGKPKEKNRGSCVLLFFLFLFFLIPGIFYLIWMLFGKRRFCPKCGHESMIPVDTPQGEKLLKELQK